MKARFLALTLGLGASLIAWNAQALDVVNTPILAPLPTTCIQSVFSSTGDEHSQSITLTLTNKCNKTVNFQDASVSFLSKIPVDTMFTGKFAPLSNPDNELRIFSRCSGENYLNSFTLHFPTTPDSVTQLPADQSISINYTASMDGHIGDANVYLQEVVSGGSMLFTNSTPQPLNTPPYGLLHIMLNGQKISDVQVPWLGSITVPNLAVATYKIIADKVIDSDKVAYQPTVIPSTITVKEGQTIPIAVSYKKIPQYAKVAIISPTKPTELTGYTDNPHILVTHATNGSSTPVTVNWGTSLQVTGLQAGATYQFSTPVINYQGYECQSTFTPATLIASTTTLPITKLSYQCKQVSQSIVNVNVSGAPTTLANLKVTFTPNDNTLPVSQLIPLTQGSGSSTVQLVTGTVYTVSADAVNGYTIKFNPQPLTAMPQATETITLTQQSADTPVAQNGQLKVCGTHLCNEKNEAIQLRGMSSHGIQWYGWQGSKTEIPCLTTASLDTLAKSWGASVMRISMYVQEDGYETDPAAFTKQVNDLIDEATKRGIYAIVDWHMLEPGDPNFNLERAKTFFTAIATAHKNNNNLLYEIANEPSGVTWATIKSYAEKLIPVIRAIDPKTVILVGTPAWSSLGISDGRNSQDIINSPVNATNIMYTFHFYAASHKAEYLNELDIASNKLPIFVTEFGTQTYTGDGANDFANTDKYMTLMASKKISWTNWNYSDDFRSGAVWKTGTCSNGPWTDANLKPAGVYIKAKIKG